MSKSATKYIYANVSGKTADMLIDLLSDGNTRKNWRNADVLARFLIDTVANAYECENSSTFESSGFENMDCAIESYIEANLCDWTQETFLASSFGKRDAAYISNRLAEAAFKNAAWEAKQLKSPAQVMQNHFNNTDAVGQRLMIADSHDLAAFMNKFIDSGKGGEMLFESNRKYCEEVRARYIPARKAMRAAACEYKEAFHAFHYHADHDTFTQIARAWLYTMDQALEMNAQHPTPFTEAKHNAHYYELLIASRQRKGYVVMTTKEGAFSYILNDAIAGDMVRSVDLHQMVIDFRDGSVLSLRDGSWMPHGFYAAVQEKRC